MIKIVLGIIIVLILLIGGFAAYQTGGFLNTHPLKNPPENLIHNQSSNHPTSHSPGMMKAHINMILLEVLNNGYYSQLLPIIDENVHLEIRGQNCCGTISKEEAIKKLRFLDKGRYPWILREDAVVEKLRATSPNDFNDAIIGISQNNYLASFKLNDRGYINKILLLPDYKLIAK